MKEISLDKILKNDMSKIDHKHLCNAKIYNSINGIINHINETMDEGEFTEIQALMVYKSVADALGHPISIITSNMSKESSLKS